MKSYRHIWEFQKDTPRLIAQGATLRDLYDAMRTVPDDDSRSTRSAMEGVQWMTQHWSQAPSFVGIRLRELFGGLEVPHDDDYILAIVGHLGGRHQQEVRLHMLRHDSELRDDIFWRIFEVEGGGEISLTNVDKYSRVDLNWHNTVILLANEGAISRTRLLRSCLEALNRDFSAYRAGWFSQLYGALAPTAVEADADQELLRLCLSSSVTATVSLAAKYLAAVQQADLLDAAEFVDACAPALAGPKVAAMGILRMLATMAVQRDAPSEAIADAAVHALAHPHTDVQRAAVKLLLKLGCEDAARASRGILAPAVAAELLPELQPADDAAEAPPFGTTVGLVTAPEPVRPWSDDDARERFAALLEFAANAIELELALAWLASTEVAAATLAPLAKRARRIEPDDARYALASLVIVAVDPATPYLPERTYQPTRTTVYKGKRVQVVGKPEPYPTEEQKTVLPSLVVRMREVATIVQGRAPRRRLLATPTDTHGWIETDVLLDRLDQARPALPIDLTQAILRVHPMDRDRVRSIAGAPPPAITEAITIKWRLDESSTRKPDGSPAWTSWGAQIVADPALEPSSSEPALIPSWEQTELWGLGRRETSPLVAAALGLVNPASSLPLVAVAAPLMHFVLSYVNHAAGPILTTLAAHPGKWNAETAQIVALGMAAHDAELRTQSVELFAAVVPTRMNADEAAIGFAACQPVVVLNRWTSSFLDAATIAPVAVIDVLTHLLPKLPRDTRGIGALLGVLVDESIRHRKGISDQRLREWLAQFSGSSTAAKTAAALLGLARGW